MMTNLKNMSKEMEKLRSDVDKIRDKMSEMDARNECVSFRIQKKTENTRGVNENKAKERKVIPQRMLAEADQ